MYESVFVYYLHNKMSLSRVKCKCCIWRYNILYKSFETNKLVKLVIWIDNRTYQTHVYYYIVEPPQIKGLQELNPGW